MSSPRRSRDTPFIDYCKSIIITSDEHIATQEHKQDIHEEVAREKRRGRLALRLPEIERHKKEVELFLKLTLSEYNVSELTSVGIHDQGCCQDPNPPPFGAKGVGSCILRGWFEVRQSRVRP